MVDLSNCAIMRMCVLGIKKSDSNHSMFSVNCNSLRNATHPPGSPPPSSKIHHGNPSRQYLAILRYLALRKALG